MGQFGKFSVNLRNFDARVKKLAAQHPKKVMRGMTSVAHLLEGETKKRTPVDEGTLTADARGEVQDYKSSYAAVISIPANAPSSSYAIKMHEGSYNLGEKSQKKAAKVAVGVGRKYITRAIDDNTEKINNTLAHELKL